MPVGSAGSISTVQTARFWRSAARRTAQIRYRLRSETRSAGMKRSITALAAHNNALWCDAVCRAHDRPGEFYDTLWLTRLGTPRFYPDAVTIAGVEAAPAQMEAIAALVGSTRRREWFVKDSFQSLDLDLLGSNAA